MIEGLVIVPAVVMGVLIGIIEILFVHSDEGAMGMTWLKHGFHALPFTILFVFVSMNVEWVLGLLPFALTGSFVTTIIVRAVVAVVAMLKVAGAAAIAPGVRGVGEKFPHIIIMGVLIFTAPYAWQYGLAPLIGAYIPF